jgi:hypothetical protein
VRTDDGQTSFGWPPRGEDLAHSREHSLEVSGFLFQQRADVPARRGSRASEDDDVLDLRECQAEPARLADKRQQAKHLDGVATVAG